MPLLRWELNAYAPYFFASTSIRFNHWHGGAVPSFSVPVGPGARNMDDLTEHIAVVADFIRPQKVLIAPLEGCLLDQQICAAFEAGVRARLENMLPSAQFVEREEVIATVKKLGFLGLDAYANGVLDKTASETGADVLITETLKWRTDAYGLAAEAFDVKKKDESLIQLELEVQRSASESDDASVVIKDPDSGLSLIVMKSGRVATPIFKAAQCTYCPEPQYSEAARKARIQGTLQLVLTVTEEGLPQDVRVAEGLEPSLDANAVLAVQRWKFSPAIGFDGKPLAVRTHFEMTFRIL